MEEQPEELSKRQKVKVAEEVDMFDFFEGNNVGTFEYAPEKQHGFKASVVFPRIIKSLSGIVVISIAMASLVILAVMLVLAYLFSATEPAVSWYKELPSDLPEASIAERNNLYDANGDIFAEVWVEDRMILDDLDQISDYAIDGLIATEDQRFWDHEGFDVRGTARAALNGGGGSGITQQLVKNLQFYDQSRSEEERWDAVDISIERKIQELRYSIAYENDHSKEEILLEYFNVVSFGGPDVYSIESASRFFFGKPASDLELHEAAVLVGSVQNTSQYDLKNPELEGSYKQRQSAVLQRMVAEDMITQEEADEAYDRDLDIQENERSGGCSQSDYPFYCEYVIGTLRDDPSIGEDAEERNAVLAQGGLNIQTAMDPELMDSMQEEVESSFGNDNRVTMPSAVVEPGTGEVMAFAFNRDYGSGDDSTEINLATSPTGTGSSFKMFGLAAALNNAGMNESQLAFGSECPWRNPNFDVPDGGIRNSVSCDFQGGYLDYRQATAWSSNTWFAELQSRIGVENISEFAESVGLRGMRDGDGNIQSRSSSYVLGTLEETPVDVAAAYATFAADGVYCPATPVRSFEYRDGTQPRVPDNYDPADKACERVISPQNAGIVLKAMRANMGQDSSIEDAFGEDAAIDDYDAVGKSGTNQLYNQAWAMVSEQYSLYSNVYDYERLTREIDGFYAEGWYHRWNDNAAQRVGARMMETALNDNQDSSNLNFDSTDNEIVPVPVDTRDFVTVPSAIGMEPAAALSIFQGTGLTVHVDKGSCDPAEENHNRYANGVIVQQSVPPGEQLPRGTDTEIILCPNS